MVLYNLICSLRTDKCFKMLCAGSKVTSNFFLCLKVSFQTVRTAVIYKKIYCFTKFQLAFWIKHSPTLKRHIILYRTIKREPYAVVYDHIYYSILYPIIFLSFSWWDILVSYPDTGSGRYYFTIVVQYRYTSRISGLAPANSFSSSDSRIKLCSCENEDYNLDIIYSSNLT